MKKARIILLSTLLCLSMLALVGCSKEASDPGTPPEEVINQVATGTPDIENPETQDSGSVAYEGELLEGAVSIRIGRGGRTEYSIDMYNNDAVTTMLDYLSGDAMLFPTDTYDEEVGFVGQNVRGNYTRDDETTIADVHIGELYLFSGGQLRLYFKDVEGANITATPIGHLTETEDLTQTIVDAYTSNLGDTWGVEVYFWITKTIE